MSAAAIVNPSTDVNALRTRFNEQGEFICVSDCLNPPAVQGLLSALPSLEPHVHRNFIPGHKKGGSISRFDLDRHAPDFGRLYRDTGLLSFLCELTGSELKYCPDDDPHTYALYYYTEAGDHIGYHYDTSYYQGERYTVLIGLVDESSCMLEYELFRDDPTRDTIAAAERLAPGTMVVFNGDKLWHRISPAQEGDRRVALTLEFVTSTKMRPFRRFVSNMKDAIAYFGFRQVFGRRDTARRSQA